MAGPAKYRVVFVRHGESVWNAAGLFTGWTDVELSEKGLQEAVEAGKSLKEHDFKFHVVFTSMLRRAIKTTWTVCSESGNFAMPVVNSWRLNERHYGALQGLSKSETAKQFGEEQVKIWRRSFDVPPPAVEESDERHPRNDPLYGAMPSSVLPCAESMKLTSDRVLPFWFDSIAPCIMSGKSVLVSAHGNSLRAICRQIEGMSDADFLEFNIPTGAPLVYELDEKLRYVRKYYLMDPDEVAKKIAAVAAQGAVAPAVPEPAPSPPLAEEAPTEVAPTEAPAPAEALAEAPTEAPAPAEAPTEVPAETGAAPEASAEAPTQAAPTESAPIEASAAEVAAEAPSDAAFANPTEEAPTGDLPNEEAKHAETAPNDAPQEPVQEEAAFTEEEPKEEATQ